MKAHIRPRTVEDRGGYACMPLRKNVPVGRDGWKLVACPECKRECWRLPQAASAEANGATCLCTECALMKGARNGD